MKLFARTLFSALLIVSSAAFNLTTPPKPSPVVNQTFNSRYTINGTEQTLTGNIGVALIAPLSDGFPCPREFTGLGFDIEDIADGYATVAISPGQTGGGNLFFRPQRAGLHLLCAYGGAPNSIKDISGLDPGSLLLVFDSPPFDVALPEFNNENDPNNENSGRPYGNKPHDGNDNKGDHGKTTDKSPIVGGVVGGIAVICLLVAFFFYRRFRYQKKLNQFHREHQLLNQIPPPSIHASDLTNPSHFPLYGTTSPPPEGIRSPESPKTIRPNSHVPLGFDETMQRSFHFPSVGSSPSSYSAPLPHEPVLRAQHVPGAGASKV